MASIFSEDHYKTAEQFGFPQFSDIWAETSAELALTLPVLEEQSSVGLSLADLQGYHFLQYRKASRWVAQTAEFIKEGAGWEEAAEILDGRLEQMLEPDELTRPLELGRIALGENTSIAPELELLTVRDTIKAYGGVQQEGDFLYPADDVELFFRGRDSLDVAAIIKAKARRAPLPDFVVHADYIGIASKDGDEEFFAALSYENGAIPTLSSIQKVQSVRYEVVGFEGVVDFGAVESHNDIAFDINYGDAALT